MYVLYMCRCVSRKSEEGIDFSLKQGLSLNLKLEAFLFSSLLRLVASKLQQSSLFPLIYSAGIKVYA